MSRAGIITFVLGFAALSVLVVLRLKDSGSGGTGRGPGGPTAVEVAAVERATIERRQILSGTIEARSRFVVAANASGRVERLLVDLSDPVQQGQVVAELNGEEQTQGVIEARADERVARANLRNAESVLKISTREQERVEALVEQGIISESEVDALRSRYVAQQSAIDVAQAQLQRAEAAKRRAGILSGYNQVIADWSGAAETRYVAQRHVAEGDTVGPNDPLVTVVDLDPLNAVISVTEREYQYLHAGQLASLSTDAYPDRSFDAKVRRIAPVFDTDSRQARIELEVANPDGLLRPGMFARIDIVFERVEEATIVPVSAVTTRNGESGLFLVDQSDSAVSWRPTDFGIQQGDRVQVRGEDLAGQVVTLGQQFLADGSAIRVVKAKASPGNEAR
jgi:RND family efflux transporter MFP subunit